jgi:hypothetical protein
MLLNLSPSIFGVIKSRRMRFAGHVARTGERGYVSRISVGKHEGRIPLGRPKRRWVGYIKINFMEVGCEGMDWIELA